MPVTACVFDAYGTLFDVAGAARRTAAEPGGARLDDCWEALAADWRERQLAYTWLRNSAGAHADFAQVTAEALDWALEARRLDGDAGLRARLLALYAELPAYPEVPGVLEALQGAGVRRAILSNGSPAMLQRAVTSAGIGTLLEAVLSVEEVGVFKPDPRVYGLIEARLGVATADVLFVSANGWDAACATGFGLRSVWLNRAGAPMERLPWRPAHVLPDLTALPDLTRSL
ncbi:MAG: haloacid dehalogenase type II [Alkalilacustris sp.]